jgi:hypothetical protein
MLLVVFPDSFDLPTTQDEAWASTIINRPQLCSHSTGDRLEFWSPPLLDWESLHGEIGRSHHLYYGILQSPWSAVVYRCSPGFVRCPACYFPFIDASPGLPT